MFKLLRLIIVLVIVVGLGVMFLPLGSVEYKDPQMAGTLVVPSFAMFEGEVMNSGGEYVANFQTVRSEWALEQEFGKMLADKYQETVCSDGKAGYLDANNHIVMRNYYIEGGLPFSKYAVTYTIGDNC